MLVYTVSFDWLASDAVSKKLILLTSKVGLKFARVEAPSTVREHQLPNVFSRQNLFRHANRQTQVLWQSQQAQ